MCARPALLTSATSGRGELREITNLARVVHAHFDHRVAMLGLQLEQHERHADVVVQIAARCEHLVCRIVGCGFSNGLPQNRSEHFLDGGLAAAAGQRDERQRKPAAPVRGEPSERTPRVVDDDEWQGFSNRS